MGMLWAEIGLWAIRVYGAVLILCAGFMVLGIATEWWHDRKRAPGYLIELDKHRRPRR